MTRTRFVIGLPLGPWQTNCYVVGDRGAGRCVVVDPGQGAGERLPDLLEAEGTDCEAVLLTHGHLDHLWDAPRLARAWDVPVLLHEDDRWLWDDPLVGFGEVLAAQLRAKLDLDWDPPHEHLETVGDGRTLTLAGIDLTVRHNPGHTPGHVTYLARGLAEADVSVRPGGAEPSEEVLLSGDLLFAGGVGRTDLPRGSRRRLLRSLVETVLPLEDGVAVLSGHGPATTVGRERAGNPFLAEARRLAVAEPREG